MASLFSASETRATVTAAVCVLWCLGLAPVTPVQGNLQIPQCSAWGWLEIVDDTEALYISCVGFDDDQTVVWQLVSNSVVQANSTCGPVATLTENICNTTNSDISVQRNNNGLSVVYITNNHRELAGNGQVRCFLQNNISTITSCGTNVITPAVVTNCEVKMTTDRTVAGTCHFTNAYSSNNTYSCTWILTPSDRQNRQDIIIQGDIPKTWWHRADGKLYYNGTCFFSRQVPAGHYNYIVRFIPGTHDSQYQGTVTDTGPPATTTPEPTTTTVSTTGSTDTPTDFLNSTVTSRTASSSTVSPTNPSSTTADLSKAARNTQDDNDDEGFPLGAVVGGVVGGVVVLAVVVVVVVIVIRRKRAKPAETKTGDDDVEYFEEHVNAAYVSSADEDQDPSPPNQHHQPKPCGVALRIPSTTTTTVVKDSSLAAPAQDADDGDYSTVDLDDDQAGGGYSTVDLDEDQAGGGYSSVDLDEDQADGGYSSVDLDEDQAGGGYSSVDMDENQAGGGYSSVDLDASGGDVYAQVDKGAKRHAPVAPRADARGGQVGGPLASTTPPGDDDEEDYYAHLAQGYTGRGGAPATAPPPKASQPTSNLGDSTSDVYAHLDHGLHGATAGGQLTGSPQAGPALTDVYAQVDKSSQGNNLTPSPPQTAEPEGHVYAHPPKPRPLIKPKPKLK